MNCQQSEIMFETLSRLAPPAALGTTHACRLCNHPAHPFTAVDFNKSCNNLPLERTGVLVEYFRCQRCELIFTDFFDRWSSDDFSRHIYNDRYIVVDPEYRMIRAKRTAEEIAPSFAGGEQCRILDYGSGAGSFEAEMRQRGFGNFASYDPFSQVERPQGQFDIVTCFDVIEHSPTPQQTLADIMSYVAPGGLALVGQTLQPADIDYQRGRWWYIAPRNGHVTFFSCETLHVYASANGLEFADFGNLFALTRAEPSDLTRKFIARRHPQSRRIVLHAPSKATGTQETWHEAEGEGTAAFRWTRLAEVSLGMHPTPRGLFRVVLRHLGARSKTFLEQSRICVGTQEQKISVHEDDIFAVFDLPFEAVREISLCTPQPFSDASAGTGTDLRAVGLAIACQA